MEEGSISDRSLPTGTITFLFSDIEGSTKLLNRLGQGYPDLLESHQRLLREAFAAGRGVEVATEGDSFFVVFPSAAQGVASAIAAQRALAGHVWPEGTEVRVRMGLHTGEAILGADNYVGIDVHRAARIAGAAHGGQILVSQATAALVEQALPEGATLRDLGEHRLKDLAQPERLFQVTAEGLLSDFPPPRSLDARPTNLPQQLTTFIGRHQELAEVKAALDETRLLTLTGPGGTGKTRLSLETAAEVLERFADGVFFVALAPITEPDLVVPTIGQALGLAEDPNRPPVEVVIDHLRDRELLLVLDNFEQVMGATPPVGEILGATDRIKVLVTSREALGLHGEREYPVPPLGVPDVDHLPSLGSLSQYEAVTLFIDRAKAVNPAFAITEENAPAVAEITARLDGLPLAIELAAARSKILSPQAMLKRLEHRLSLLAGGARDRPGRQQTLRDAIAWSWDLLDEAERSLFATVSVFVGGFTLEAVEAVEGGDAAELDPFEGVASLVNKSLLRQMEGTGGEPRFFMLETIREFALERLEERDDAGSIRSRHAGFFLDLAERAAPELTGTDQARWLDAVDAEHGNLRAAIEWALEAGQADVALRLGGALWRFWQMRGHLREGRERIERVLSASASGSPEARARALEAAGGITYWMGDWEASRRAYEECLSIRRELSDPRGIGEALYNLSFTYSVPPPPLLDYPKAQLLLEESAEAFRAAGDRAGRARVLWGLGNVAYRSGDIEQGQAVAAEGLDISRELGDLFSVAWSLHLLGLFRITAHDPEGAKRYFREALQIFSASGDLSGISLLLADFAAADVDLGEERRAAVLVGAAYAVQEKAGSNLLEAVIGEERWAWNLDRSLTEPALAEAREEGAQLGLEAAVALALGSS